MLVHTWRVLLLFLSCCSVFVLNAQDSTNFVVVKEVKIIGNKTTQRPIIIREIPFEINDTIQNAHLNTTLERVKDNLLNTSLFNFVTVSPVYFDATTISLYITVEERWYWWPIPIAKIETSNFNAWWTDKEWDKLSYGIRLSKENFRGRKETLSFILQDGFTEKAGVNYILPYINKKKTMGLSMLLSYSRNKTVSYELENNKRIFYQSENKHIQQEMRVGLGYEFRPKLYHKHRLNGSYTEVAVAETVLGLNPNYLHQGKKEMNYFAFQYAFKCDQRNFRNYPTTGSYFDLKMFKHGFGVFSTLNSLYATSHFKKFWQLTDRTYLASSIKAKATIKDAPYYLLNGFAFGNDLVRGYELYVINAENYGLGKIQWRYALLQNKVFQVDAIRFQKFHKIPLDIYLGTYLDAGYTVLENDVQQHSLSNAMLLGGGLSLDFVSYYDLVLRVEYSRNKLNEQGIFIHFIAPI